MATPKSIERPLSPHLQVYRPMLTMMLSIIHRITGGALYFGTLLVAWWLISAASGPAAYETAQWVFGSILGRLVLFGYSFALIHHMLGGLKHLVWDAGTGFTHPTREQLAIGHVAASVVLTLLVWIVAILVR